MFWDARHERKTQIDLRGHGSALPLITCAFRVRWLASTPRFKGKLNSWHRHQQTPNQADAMISTKYRTHPRAQYIVSSMYCIGKEDHAKCLPSSVYRTKKEHQAKFAYCPDSNETVDLFLLYCPIYDIRTRLLPAQPTSTIQLQWTGTVYIQHVKWDLGPRL